MDRRDNTNLQQGTAPSNRLISDYETPAPKDGRVAITTFGLPRDEAQRVLDAITSNKQFRKREFILVMTDVHPSWIVSSCHRVELLPSRETLGVLNSTERKHWIESRWSILKAKWDIRSEIALGQPYEGFLSVQ